MHGHRTAVSMAQRDHVHQHKGCDASCRRARMPGFQCSGEPGTAEFRGPTHAEILYRAAAAGALAIGSKAAFMLKGAGGASGLLKGAGVLAAAGADLACLSPAYRRLCIR